MKCDIKGETFRFDEPNIEQYGDYTMLRLGSQEYFIFESSEQAGELAKEYWEDLADSDPEEFATLVGSANLVAWGRGEYAGPGSTQTQSMEEWFDLWLETPEEQFASYDGEEKDIFFNFCTREMYCEDGQIQKYDEDKVNEKLMELFGFIPTVAYRQN